MRSEGIAAPAVSLIDRRRANVLTKHKINDRVHVLPSDLGRPERDYRGAIGKQAMSG